MSQTYSVSKPTLFFAGGYNSVPNIQAYPFSAHCNDSDILVLASGQVAPAAANVAGAIIGLAESDSSLNYAGQNPANAYDYTQSLGYSQVGSILPASPGQLLVAQFDFNTFLEINLPASVQWNNGGGTPNLGTQVGIAIDGTTGFYTVDPAASNKVAFIVARVQDAMAQPVSDVGNFAVRVRVQFIASTLA